MTDRVEGIETGEPGFFHRWHHLTDLPANRQELAVPQLAVVADLWRTRLGELRGSTVLDDFNARLARRWSIETGIIEGVYRIDRGITELLIEKGIEAALIRQGTTDRPAEDVVQILRDHENTLEGIFAFVAQQRQLSASYIAELHQELCRSQESVVTRDQFGGRQTRPLSKGVYKQLPNSPLRTDGQVHEYCPPEHVASEMDELVRLHREHGAAGVAPEVEAAWLHHRFAQIHPFEDGNGRVARALASLVLLRAELFPFVVDRDEYGEYIDALESADRGDLHPLIRMIARQQQQALLAALDLSRDVMRDQEVAQSVEAALDEAVTRIHRREVERRQERFRAVVERAEELLRITEERMEDVGKQFEQRLSIVPSVPAPRVDFSTEDQGFWFRQQVIQAANELHYFANMNAWHRWLRLTIPGEPDGQIVVSIHQSGRDFRGLFMASAFFEYRDRDRETSAEGRTSVRLGSEGFAISLREDVEAMKSRFRTWLSGVLTAGIQEYSKGI